MAGTQNQYTINGNANVTGPNFNVEKGNQTVNNGPVYYGNSDEFRSLKAHSAPEAIHTSAAVWDQGTCTAGTREKTLERIQSLATSSDSSSPDLIWVHGVAGAGKSAIMRTTAQNLDAAGTLLASFFFFRSEERRKTSAHFIPTLALQVSEKLPQAVNPIIHSLQQNHSLFSKALHLQCLHLLQTPLINALTSPDVHCGWTSTSPRVIVIDGLDECMDDGGQEKVIKALVQFASAIRADTNCRIKIVVASRPEVRIETEFDRLRANDQATVIRLDSSDAKLHLFYAERLEKIREKNRGLENWPSEEDLKWLMDKTSGQYAFADISTRHLAGGDPVHRLRVIRQAFIDVGRDGNPFEPLDLLYATVLKQIPLEMRQDALHVLRLRLGKAPGWRQEMRSIVEPLLQLPHGFISRLSSHISSLIDFEHDLRPYHASFADFLLDPSRLARLELHIEESLFRKTILKGLFAPVSQHTRRLDTREIAGFSKLTYSPVPALAINERQIALFAESTNSRMAMMRSVTPSMSEEVIALLNAVDLSLLDFWASCYFFRLCQFIHSGGISEQGPPFGSRLWYMVSLSFPRQMKAVWMEKSASYREGQGITNVAECAIGLLLVFLTRSPNDCDKVLRGLQDAIRGSDQLSNVDVTRGWNFRSHLPDRITRAGVRLIYNAVLGTQDTKHALKCVQIALYEILRAGNDSEHMHPIVARLVDREKEHPTNANGVGESPGCGGCSGNLVHFKSQAIESWLNLLQFRRTLSLVPYPDWALLVLLHTWMQGNEICYHAIYGIGRGFTHLLRSRRGSLTPSFASSRKRKLLEICALLHARAAALKKQRDGL